MARRSGLGKGLGALIPSDVLPAVAAEDASSPGLLEVALSQIVPNRFQPRSHFDDETLASLTASIRELGVLQPVLVRRSLNGTFELIAGERRWRAAKRAGLATIPVIVRTANDTLALEEALVENLHRADLNPLEEAAAYQQLLEDFTLTHEEVARRVGKSRAAVSNTLRLFQLPPAVQRFVHDGQLGAGHARALLGSPDRSFQEMLARRVVAEGWSVRQVEEAVSRRNGESGDKSSKGSGRLRPPGLLELEELLSDRLDTRVNVTMGAKRGKVVIDFASLEDLERIYRAMSAPPADAGDVSNSP